MQFSLLYLVTANLRIDSGINFVCVESPIGVIIAQQSFQLKSMKKNLWNPLIYILASSCAIVVQ